MKIILPYRTLIVLAGCPFTGKTAIGKELQKRFEIPFVMVDQLRRVLFGETKKSTDPDGDAYQLSRAYPAMSAIADKMLFLGESVMVEGTFSRGLQEILYVVRKYNARMKILFCDVPEDSAKKIIEERVSARPHSDPSAACSIDDYFKVKARFEPINLPHLFLDTSQPLDECVEKAAEYVERDC